MNIQEPYKINDINFDNIVFKKTKLIGNKKIIFIKYKDNKLNNFVIQLSKIQNNNVNNQNEIEFIIDNPIYIDLFEKLDNFVIDQAHKNYIWFDHLDNKSSMNYQRILREDNSIKLRLCNNDELVTKLFINNNICDNFDDIISNESTTKIILEIYAVWIKNNTFGLLLRPINILMKINEKELLGNLDNNITILYEKINTLYNNNKILPIYFGSEKNKFNGYVQKCDVYALAYSIFETLYVYSEIDVRQNVQLYDLLIHMMALDPDKRYNAVQCLSHPYFHE